MTELPSNVQEEVKTAGFNHFHPWRMVRKGDSVSTPVRIVVDPTMTGMNAILAKGENRLGKVNEIILRYRTKKEVWTTDI